MTKLSGLSAGIPTGLKVTLFFLISFFLLGYSAMLSLFLAIVGGVASGFIVDWWGTKDTSTFANNQAATQPNTAQTSPDPQRFGPATAQASRAQRWQRYRRRSRKPRTSVNPAPDINIISEPELGE